MRPSPALAPPPVAALPSLVHAGAFRDGDRLPAFNRVPRGRHPRVGRCEASHSVTAAEVKAFAPSTVANLGPGFDWLGCAVEGRGDTVTCRPLEDLEGVVIQSIDGDGGRLSMKAKDNCAGIAVRETLKLIEQKAGLTLERDYGIQGIGLDLHKGLPLGSGLGSSAASAAAAAMAANVLLGEPIPKQELVKAGLVSESVVSGYHADNIAPAILGGFVLVRSTRPLLLSALECPVDLWFVVVTPVFEAPTKKMRAALPKRISMDQHIANAGAAGELMLGIMGGDLERLGHGLSSDTIVEPARAPLIPGFQQVKEAALEAGAFGCTISGAGPTSVAVVSGRDEGIKVAEAMKRAFAMHGGLEIQYSDVVKLCKAGAKVVE